MLDDVDKNITNVHQWEPSVDETASCSWQHPCVNVWMHVTLNCSLRPSPWIRICIQTACKVCKLLHMCLNECGHLWIRMHNWQKPKNLDNSSLWFQQNSRSMSSWILQNNINCLNITRSCMCVCASLHTMIRHARQWSTSREQFQQVQTTV